MGENALSKTLMRVFWVLFILAFLPVLAAALTGGWENLAGFLPCLALLWVVWWLCSRERLPEKWLLAAFCLCFAIFVGVQLYTALTQYFVPRSSGDVEAIYTGVRELVENGRLTDSTLYFLRHEHQVFALAELYLFTHLTLLLGGSLAVPHQAFGVLAAVGVDIAILCLVGAVRLWKDSRAALATGFCLLAMTPLINGTTYAYTHVLGYPYIYGALFLFALATTRCRGRAFGAAVIAGGGGLLGLGCLMSGSAWCLLAAFLIWLVLKCGWRELLARALPLLAGLLLVTAGFKLFWAHSGWIDHTNAEKERIPLTHWVMVGLNEEGNYSEEDLEATVAIAGARAKTDHTLNEIGRRLSQLGPGGFVAHLWGKVRATWSGLPFGGPVLGGFPPGPLRHGLLPALAALLLAGAVLAFKQPKADGRFLLCLALFGVMLFLLVWETANRYIYPWLPLLVWPALEGAAGVWAAVASRLRRRGGYDKIEPTT